MYVETRIIHLGSWENHPRVLSEGTCPSLCQLVELPGRSLFECPSNWDTTSGVRSCRLALQTMILFLALCFACLLVMFTVQDERRHQQHMLPSVSMLARSNTYWNTIQLSYSCFEALCLATRQPTFLKSGDNQMARAATLVTSIFSQASEKCQSSR